MVGHTEIRRPRYNIPRRTQHPFWGIPAKSASLNPTSRRHQTSPHQGSFHKITGLYSSKCQGHKSQGRMGNGSRVKEMRRRKLNATSDLTLNSGLKNTVAGKDMIGTIDEIEYGLRGE